MKRYTKEEVEYLIKEAFYTGMTYEEFVNWKPQHSHIPKGMSPSEYVMNYIKDILV